VRKDKLPKLANDPTYASRKNFTVIDRATGQSVPASSVDWTDPAAATEYQLIQGPGASNALGDLKIIFPNQYSVYLHGTPGKRLFERAQRTFSSGCVRLERPEDMAKWLAAHDPEVSARDVSEALEGATPERIDFKSETRIHITYMTVTVNEDGEAHFWRDVYHEEDGIMMVDKYAPLYQPASDEELAQAEPAPRKG
jgi:murein L,D-transpeptidase YcbB/YkuD